jgi:ATP-dependent Lon protease
MFMYYRLPWLGFIVLTLAFSHNSHAEVQENLNEQLLLATAQGETQQVIDLIRAGADVNTTDARGFTPLIFAAQIGNNAIALELLRHGANVDAANDVSDTALKWAAYNGRLSVTKTLLMYKATVDLQDLHGNTALIDAAFKGHAKIVTLLIQHKANVNHENHRGETALTVAKKNRHAAVLAVLNKYKAQEGSAQEDGTDSYMEKLRTLPLPKPVKKDLWKLILQLEEGNPLSYEKEPIKEYLDMVFSLPWDVTTQDNFDLANAKKVLDEDHYGLKEVKEHILDFIATLNFSKKGKAPILCLVGPSGIGKTSLGKSIARALGRKYIRMAVGGLHDESELRGHRRTYIGARPGRIVQSLKTAQSMNPIFVIDEIDKMGQRGYHGDPTAAMLEILDPEQNKAFRDNYLEIPIDLSRALFITTANSVADIPAPLRDRMEIIYLSSYTEEEKLAIAENHLVQQAVADAGLESKKIKIGKEVLNKLIKEYASEAGVRQTKRNLARLMAKVARGLIENGKVVTIDTLNLEKYLGPAPYKDLSLDITSQVGVSNVLYWSPMGGSINKVEVTLLPRTHKEAPLQITGQLQDVMLEATRIALSYTRAHAHELNIPQDMFENYSVHIHYPDGAQPKDGPSTGISTLVAIISAFTKKPIKGHYAMTGELNLRGQVCPIGGIKEKLLAAKNQGITHLLLPLGNKHHYDAIDGIESIAKGLKVTFVKHVDEVLKIVLL